MHQESWWCGNRLQPTWLEDLRVVAHPSSSRYADGGSVAAKKYSKQSNARLQTLLIRVLLFTFPVSPHTYVPIWWPILPCGCPMSIPPFTSRCCAHPAASARYNRGWPGLKCHQQAVGQCRVRRSAAHLGLQAAAAGCRAAAGRCRHAPGAAWWQQPGCCCVCGPDDTDGGH